MRGHISTKCPSKKEGSVPAKKVSLCSTVPTELLEHEGEFFSFYFDCGSECSLLISSLERRFIGERFSQIVKLHGLGFKSVVSKLQVKSRVNINGVELEILLHVIDDSILFHKIIVGSEILNSNLVITLNENQCILSKTVNIAYKRKINSISEQSNITSINKEAGIEFGSEMPLVGQNNKLGINTEGISFSSFLDSNNDPSNSHLKTCQFTELLPVKEGNLSSLSSFSVQSNTDDDVFRNINTDIPPKHTGELLSILRKYTDLFITGIPTRRVTTGEFKINLIDANKILNMRPYKFSPKGLDFSRDRIKELETAKVIRKSLASFSSAAFLIPKTDGDFRLAVDYRSVNDNTVAQRFPLPLISDQIDRLCGATYFTIIDMASRFYQIPVESTSIDKTAFVTPDGQWEFLAMSFGVRNGPSVFQRALINALGELAMLFVIWMMCLSLPVVLTKLWKGLIMF